MAYPDGASLTAMFRHRWSCRSRWPARWRRCLSSCALFAVRRDAGRVLPLTIVSLLIGTLALFAVLDRMAINERAIERNALMARDAELAARALDPASALACLDGAAGDAVESACEKKYSPARKASPPRSPMLRRGCRCWPMACAMRAAPILPLPPNSPACAARSNSTASASPRMCWRSATAARPNAARPSRCSRCQRAASQSARRTPIDQYVARHVEAWNDTEPAAGSSRQPPSPAAGRQRSPSRRWCRAGHPVSAPLRFPLGGLDPACQHHECGAESAARRRAAPQRRPMIATPRAGLPLPPKRPQAASGGRRPRASIRQSEAGSRDVLLRPDRQSRRNRLPHRPHRAAARPAHHCGLFAGRRGALHVRLCDEAHEIGPAPARESYLRIDKIDRRRQSGAAPMHPSRLWLPVGERRLRAGLPRRRHRLRRPAARRDPRHGAQGPRQGADGKSRRAGGAGLPRRDAGRRNSSSRRPTRSAIRC